MTALNILINLKVYRDLLNEIHRHELNEVTKKEDFIRLEKSLKIEYSFVTLELELISKGVKETEQHLYCKVSFELKNSNPALKEVYLEDSFRTEDLRKIIANHQSVNNYRWQEHPTASVSYKANIIRYLTIADTIAQQAYNCASGDNYYPGYFSKVILYDDQIVLSQINHMNSRSLNHKTDYSLRDLEFTIPLSTVELKTSFDDTQIGDMIIHFSDRSSANNKPCGDLIAEQIESEKAKYIQSNSKS